MISAIVPMSLMPTFDEALRDHATVPLLEKAFKQIGVPDGGREYWSAITDASFQATTTVGAQIALWMPTEYIPVLRAKSVIAATFALACMAEQLAAHHAQGNAAPPDDPQAASMLVKEGWKKFEERAALASTLQSGGFGGGGGGSLDACWEHARAVQQVKDPMKIEEVKKIADLAGRMYTVLQNAGPTIEQQGVGEVRTVERGADFEKVLPEDLAKAFDDGPLGDAGTMDVLEGKTSQYAMTQVVPGSRGPLVILRDESGSMADAGQDKNTWASACAVALSRTAHDSGRMASVVHYATATSVTDLAPGDSAAMLKMAQHFLGGGTAIGLALEKGIERVKALAATGNVGADIVLITDGEDGDVARIDKAIDTMDRLGIDLYTVTIEAYLNDDHPIIKRAKKVVKIGDTSQHSQQSYSSSSSSSGGFQKGGLTPQTIEDLIEAAMNRPAGNGNDSN